jgi:PTS system N-acetylglucosamine-specific IIC component
MYHTALPGRRRAVAGLLGSIALTSLLTGVTEPIEFTFIFLAPALYAVHALLTGIAFVVMNALHVRLGFGFSAGLFDYVLNFNRATRPLWLLPVGVGYFALYYTLFRFVIVRFDLKTPGRDPTPGGASAAAPAGPTADRALQWLAALGGAANLQAVSACTTRLRLTVASQSAVDASALTRLGALGLVRPSANALQVVVGTVADQLAGEIREAQRSAPAGLAQPATLFAAPAEALTIGNNLPDGAALITALGGRANVLTAEAAAGRVRVGVTDAARVNREALLGLGLRGVALPEAGCVHLLTGTAMSAGVAALLARATS